MARERGWGVGRCSVYKVVVRDTGNPIPLGGMGARV